MHPFLAEQSPRPDYLYIGGIWYVLGGPLFDLIEECAEPGNRRAYLEVPAAAKAAKHGPAPMLTVGFERFHLPGPDGKRNIPAWAIGQDWPHGPQPLLHLLFHRQ